MIPLLVGACTAAVADGDGSEEATLAPLEAQADFLSLAAREYVLAAPVTLTIAPDLSTSELARYAALERSTIERWLSDHLYDSNKVKDGLSGVVKYDAQAVDVRRIDATHATFTFRETIATKANLRASLTFDADGTLPIWAPIASLETFDATPNWLNGDAFHVTSAAYFPAENRIRLRFTVTEQPQESDAWWDYVRLFADGRLTIDVHFGWDYWAALHVTYAKELYDTLLQRGFTSPVARWADYTRQSGPLTKTMQANGRRVVVEVRIFYPKSGGDNDPDTTAGAATLMADMRASLKQADVIVYQGHSGPSFGFGLGNFNKSGNLGRLSPDDLRATPMAQGKYQIVMAKGCNTYGLGEAFLRNPTKNGKDVDVITETQQGSIRMPPVYNLIDQLIAVDASGRQTPRTLSTFLRATEEIDTPTSQPMYGVHGNADDPHLHPYANVAALCTPCGRNDDCGGVGNLCVAGMGIQKMCTAECTDDTGCPRGYACRFATFPSSSGWARVCTPSVGSCDLR